MIILEIFLLGLWVVVGMGGTIVATVCACLWYDEHGSTEGPARFVRFAGIVIGGLFTLSAVIGLPFATGAINIGNGSEHCGPGTVYQSESHGSGKTRRTEWWCERA